MHAHAGAGIKDAEGRLRADFASAAGEPGPAASATVLNGLIEHIEAPILPVKRRGEGMRRQRDSIQYRASNLRARSVQRKRAGGGHHADKQRQ
jgi:hypothetical protein